VPRLARRWRPEAPPRSPLEQHRERIRAGLVPAEPWMLTAITPRLDPDLLAASQAAVRERYAAEEEARNRTERVTYTIDLTRELLLVKHGYDPRLPPNGTRNRGPGSVNGMVIGRIASGPREGWGLVYMPLRNGVCELEGVEIDGHEPSDLDPLGGCMWCGRQDIYGDGDDGQPLRFDNPGTGQ
jgi:hypothetical protein